MDGTTIGGGAPTGGGGTTGGGGGPTGGGGTAPGGGTTGAGEATPPGTTAAGPPPGGSTGAGGTSPPGGGSTAGGAGTDAPPTGGGTTAPSGGGTTAPPAGGGTTLPPGGGTTAPTDGGTAAPPGGTTVPGGGTAVPPGGTTVPTDGGTTGPGGGTTAPSDGVTTIPGPIVTTTTPSGDITTTYAPEPVTTGRSRSWDVTSTWCPPELSTVPQFAAQPTFTGTTVIDGTSWVQTTLDAPLTTVYTTESLYTEHGQAMTKYVPVTTVIPPGTVVIRHNLAVGKKSSKVPIVAGALGGVAALLLIGALAFFLTRRRRRREAAGNLHIDIDPTTPTHAQPPYPGLPPLMSEATGNSTLLQPSVTGSTGYGGVVGAQHNASAYGYAGRPSMDTTSMGGASSMYASTNYGRSTSPNMVGAQPVHYRSPSAASGGMVPMAHQGPGPNSMSGHMPMGHYRAESGPVGIVQEDDPLLGPFSDNNRVPTPSSVMPLVHEDAGSVRNVEVGGAWSPPAYEGGGASRM